MAKQRGLACTIGAGFEMEPALTATARAVLEVAKQRGLS